MENQPLYDLIQQIMQLNSQDAEIIRQGVKTRFWELIKEYMDEKTEELKHGIVSRVSEEMSKTKYNDRDLMLAEVQLTDEFMETPERLLNMIINQTDNMAEAETAE